MSQQSNRSSAKLSRIWTILVGGGIVTFLGVLANLTQILAFFHIGIDSPSASPEASPTPSSLMATTPSIYATPFPVISTSAFNVGSLTKTGLNVTLGDQIKITASGSVCVGRFVTMLNGCASPDGVSLVDDIYDIVPSYLHAALLCRINRPRPAQESDWLLCGTRKIMDVEHTGELELDINDNKQGDNSGQFEVEVTLTRSSSP